MRSEKQPRGKCAKDHYQEDPIFLFMTGLTTGSFSCLELVDWLLQWWQYQLINWYHYYHLIIFKLLFLLKIMFFSRSNSVIVSLRPVHCKMRGGCLENEKFSMQAYTSLYITSTMRNHEMAWVIKNKTTKKNKKNKKKVF